MQWTGHTRTNEALAKNMAKIAQDRDELLTALRDLLDNCGASIGTTPAVERARAAIANAESDAPSRRDK